MFKYLLLICRQFLCSPYKLNTFRVFSEYAYICTFRVFSIDAGVSVVDTGSKKIVVNANLWKDATTDVNDIGGAPCLANIAENVR
jgi:hypothetical protein